MNRQIEVDNPVSFGYKCAWLAIRTLDIQDVIAKLRLTDVYPSTWKKGIEDAYQGRVFITPIIKEWALVVSTNLPWPDPRDNDDACTHLLLHLGLFFPEVQYFSTHRVVNAHAWARVVDGKIVRQYAYIGDQGVVYWNKGVETPEEVQMRIEQEEEDRRYAEEESEEWEDETGIGYFIPREGTVMRMASIWSINPTTISSLNISSSYGYVGTFKETY